MIKPVIDAAKTEDITQLIALGYASFKENELAECCSYPDFDKVAIGFASMVYDTNGAVFVIRNENPKIVDGVLALKRDCLWWSNDSLLIEGFFYIKPEVRSFKLAKALLSKAKECAIINKVPIVMDLFTQKDVDEKKKLLKYMGFKEIGSFYIFIPEKDITTNE